MAFGAARAVAAAALRCAENELGMDAAGMSLTKTTALGSDVLPFWFCVRIYPLIKTYV